ncbi:MAG: hypothetical protein HYU52_17015 [Acidobacteria bacterium]|nr:hypothetical protein [Acidobacteriota bacterium]
MGFRDALAAISELRDAGVVTEYAVGGAMAMVFWSEPVATYDLDVFVLLPPGSGLLVSLSPIYEWAKAHDYAIRQEHIIIGGVPVQVIPAHNALAEEAVREAETIDYEGAAVRVIRPEHLIALCLEPSARSRKRLERVAALLECGAVDQTRLDAILHRHGLSFPGEQR